MRKIKDILRLHLVGGVSSCRQLARAAACGKSAVADCLRRAAEARSDRWETIAALDESDLEQRLYPPSTNARHSQTPAAARLEQDPRGAGSTRSSRDLGVAVDRIQSRASGRNQYSQFVDLYRRFEKKLSVVLRQHHRAGEKVFVDFCDGITMIDPDSGELVKTHLFVGALGASSYTFAIATLSQALPVWLNCHVRNV